MAFYLSPLVDVKEVDLTTTIQAAATSIGQIVIRNPRKGPEMKRTFVDNDEVLIDKFGTPTNEASNFQDMLSASMALQYMNKLYCTAVRPADATFAGIYSESVTPSGATDPVTEFSQLETTGEHSFKLADFDSLDPDDFADEVTPMGFLDMIASSRGAWGNNIRVAFVSNQTFNTIVNLEQDIDKYAFAQDLAAIDTSIDEDKEFIVIVQELPEGADDYEKNWDTVEYWNVSTDQDATDSQGSSKFAEASINGGSKYIRIAFNEFKKNDPFDIVHTDWIRMAGGSNGDTTADLDSEIMEALDLYANPEEVDVNIIIESNKSDTIKQYIVSLCDERLDCFGLIDVHYEHVVNNKGNEVSQLINWRKGLGDFETNNFNVSTDKVAIYANWLEVYDRWNKKYRWVPASGALAAIYANNDDVSDPWFAPAGLNRGMITNVRRLAFSPRLAQRDMLYKNALNPITAFAGQGKVVWGQKTALSKPSAFNRVNVRRLFNVLEKSISTAVKWILFEPNDPNTRLQLLNMIEPFLRDVKSRRGIYEYKVVCDSTNNTDERIDRNELWVDIMIQPAKTTEFLVLRFTATKTGASFSEVAEQLS